MEKSKRVAIIDFQMGNLFSVFHACRYVGLDAFISSDATEILAADAAILPGVGAFGDAMENMKTAGLDRTVSDFLATGKPFMGICLGMQILLTESEEFGAFKGLNIIPGVVKRIPRWNTSGNMIRVPQIGWNRIKILESFDMTNTPLCELKNNSYMYFVHSFFAEPDDSNVVLTTTNYEGFNYCSSILKDNLFACQFHPEKSAKDGLKIYSSWANAIE